MFSSFVYSAFRSALSFISHSSLVCLRGACGQWRVVVDWWCDTITILSKVSLSWRIAPPPLTTDSPHAPGARRQFPFELRSARTGTQILEYNASINSYRYCNYTSTAHIAHAAHTMGPGVARCRSFGFSVLLVLPCCTLFVKFRPSFIIFTLRVVSSLRQLVTVLTCCMKLLNIRSDTCR